MESKSQINNSIRGAAISLCMTVDELVQILSERKSSKPSESGVQTDSLKLLERIAELETTNKALKEENNHLKLANKALTEFFVVRF